MLFNSLQFLVFFMLVAMVYATVHRHLRLRNGFLLLASYGFYGAWDWRFLGLILISTLVDFSISKRLPDVAPRQRRQLVTVSLIVNLGILCTFKYLDFGIQSLVEMASWAGWDLDVKTLGIILPVGISFYTFQTIGYTLDVAAGRRRPVNSLLNFALYVAYFPQLVAGPIERSTALLPQLEQVTHPGWEEFRRGVLWVLSGYFFKVVCADTIAPLVDEAYSRPEMIGGPVLILATLGFSVQIFCDFAGYSLIARGISEWFGIHLMENFRSPYVSLSPREFWRRWHISLSTWLRDYLYIPLGGSRRGTARKCLNLLIVFSLCGLWHGAGWNFILFGAFWGVWLAGYTIYENLLSEYERRAPESLPVQWFRDKIPFSRPMKGLIVMVGILVSWVFFRSPDMRTALNIFEAILTDWHLDPSFGFYARSVGILFVLVWGYSWLQEYRNDQDFLLKEPKWIRWTLVSFSIFCLLTVGFRPVPFIYFQF